MFKLHRKLIHLGQNRFLRLAVILSSLICTIGCQPQKSESAMFSEVDPKLSKVDFANTLAVNDSMNFFKYGYFYMGGGVASGDINNDGLVDLFFTANMKKNKLYLNKGELEFEDITQEAGFSSSPRWHTGCTFIDINNDEKLDIYVSVAGIWNERNNLLYVNQGNDNNGIPQFSEQAQQYGLDDAGFSIQTAFFDYDNDGDLDAYVVNYPPTSFDSKVVDYKRRVDEVTLDQSDRLYRNNGDDTFTDVTEQAGLLQFGLGIGVITTDFNQDGFIDIYISNDFHTPDFFYVNNGDGTFTESLQQSFQHTSFYGMGVDAADLNNDLLLDMFQVDMSSTNNYRSKANMASMNIPAFWAGVQSGFHYQYMFNSLQMNNGIKTDTLPFFSDIAMANDLHSTDWSWACLLADYDNDGLKDIFVSNGVRRDINNKDYFKWLNQTDTKLKVKFNELDFVDLTNKMPFEKTDNHIFKNNGDTFSKANQDWGLSYSGFSNGASYADLDNDGDLEIILNNIDSTAAIFKNLATEQGNNYLKIALHGPAKNTLALGTKVYLYANKLQLFHEHTLVRGYQSSVDPNIHFGLGKNETIDSINVVWPDGKKTLLLSPKTNQLLHIDYKNSQSTSPLVANKTSPLLISSNDSLFDFRHIENAYDDYLREVLLPHKMSSFGPGLAKADINSDGQDDIVITGAKLQSTIIYRSKITGDDLSFETFELSNSSQEDVFAEFADINNDGHLDLLIASGGNEEDDLSSSYYAQRYYLNDGEGIFSTATFIHPELRCSASVIAPADIDGDGQLEIFIGGRQIPGVYPSATDSYIFRDGIDVTADLAPDLARIGLVTDALWSDYDADNDLDLIVIGEWMGITIFENSNGLLRRQDMPGISDQIGWWKTITSADYDNDGDMDYLIGNLGLNYKYKASDEATFDVYAHDFDENSKQDIVLSFYEEGEQYPVRGRQCSSEQMPALSARFPNYHSFASSSLDQIYGDDFLDESTHYEANNFQHIYLENEGNGKLSAKPLPPLFQRYSINTVANYDLNKDGNIDLVFAGNIFDSEVETPRSDACFGMVALGDGKGDFHLLSFEESGLYVPYETQDIEIISLKNKEIFVLFANNDAPVSGYILNKAWSKNGEK